MPSSANLRDSGKGALSCAGECSPSPAPAVTMKGKEVDPLLGNADSILPASSAPFPRPLPQASAPRVASSPPFNAEAPLSFLVNALPPRSPCPAGSSGVGNVTSVGGISNENSYLCSYAGASVGGGGTSSIVSGSSHSSFAPSANQQQQQWWAASFQSPPSHYESPSHAQPQSPAVEANNNCMQRPTANANAPSFAESSAPLHTTSRTPQVRDLTAAGQGQENLGSHWGAQSLITPPPQPHPHTLSSAPSFTRIGAVIVQSASLRADLYSPAGAAAAVGNMHPSLGLMRRAGPLPPMPPLSTYHSASPPRHPHSTNPQPQPVVGGSLSGSVDFPSSASVLAPLHTTSSHGGSQSPSQRRASNGNAVLLPHPQSPHLSQQSSAPMHAPPRPLTLSPLRHSGPPSTPPRPLAKDIPSPSAISPHSPNGGGILVGNAAESPFLVRARGLSSAPLIPMIPIASACPPRTCLGLVGTPTATPRGKQAALSLAPLVMPALPFCLTLVQAAAQQSSNGTTHDNAKENSPSSPQQGATSALDLNSGGVCDGADDKDTPVTAIEVTTPSYVDSSALLLSPAACAAVLPRRRQRASSPCPASSTWHSEEVARPTPSPSAPHTTCSSGGGGNSQQKEEAYDVLLGGSLCGTPHSAEQQQEGLALTQQRGGGRGTTVPSSSSATPLVGLAVPCGVSTYDGDIDLVIDHSRASSNTCKSKGEGSPFAESAGGTGAQPGSAVVAAGTALAPIVGIGYAAVEGDDGCGVVAVDEEAYTFAVPPPLPSPSTLPHADSRRLSGGGMCILSPLAASLGCLAMAAANVRSSGGFSGSVSPPPAPASVLTPTVEAKGGMAVTSSSGFADVGDSRLLYTFQFDEDAHRADAQRGGRPLILGGSIISLDEGHDDDDGDGGGGAGHGAAGREGFTFYYSSSSESSETMDDEEASPLSATSTPPPLEVTAPTEKRPLSSSRSRSPSGRARRTDGSAGDNKGTPRTAGRKGHPLRRYEDLLVNYGAERKRFSYGGGSPSRGPRSYFGGSAPLMSPKLVAVSIPSPSQNGTMVATSDRTDLQTPDSLAAVHVAEPSSSPSSPPPRQQRRLPRDPTKSAAYYNALEAARERQQQQQENEEEGAGACQNENGESKMVGVGHTSVGASASLELSCGSCAECFGGGIGVGESMPPYGAAVRSFAYGTPCITTEIEADDGRAPLPSPHNRLAAMGDAFAAALPSPYSPRHLSASPAPASVAGGSTSGSNAMRLSNTATTATAATSADGTAVTLPHFASAATTPTASAGAHARGPLAFAQHACTAPLSPDRYNNNNKHTSDFMCGNTSYSGATSPRWAVSGSSSTCNSAFGVSNANGYAGGSACPSPRPHQRMDAAQHTLEHPRSDSPRSNIRSASAHSAAPFDASSAPSSVSASASTCTARTSMHVIVGLPSAMAASFLSRTASVSFRESVSIVEIPPRPSRRAVARELSRRRCVDATTTTIPATPTTTSSTACSHASLAHLPEQD